MLKTYPAKSIVQTRTRVVEDKQMVSRVLPKSPCGIAVPVGWTLNDDGNFVPEGRVAVPVPGYKLDYLRQRHLEPA